MSSYLDSFLFELLCCRFAGVVGVVILLQNLICLYFHSWEGVDVLVAVRVIVLVDIFHMKASCFSVCIHARVSLSGLVTFLTGCM